MVSVSNSKCRAVGALLLFAFFALWGQPLIAKAKSKVPAEARRLYKEGTAEYNIGQFRIALSKFQAAAKIHSHPLFILAVAQCHRQLGNLEKALFGYKLYRSMNAGRRFKDLDAKIAVLEKQLAEKRAAEAKKAAEAKQGAAQSPAAEQGAIELRGLPVGATVTIDDRPLADGLQAQLLAGNALPLRVGKHEVRITKQGYLAWRRSIRVESRKTVVAEVTMISLAQPRGTGWLVGAVVSSSLAVVAEVTALIFTSMANDELETSSSFARYRDLAIASHVVAGVSGAAAIVSWIFFARSGGERANEPPPDQASLLLLPTPGGVTLSWSGAF